MKSLKGDFTVVIACGLFFCGCALLAMNAGLYLKMPQQGRVQVQAVWNSNRFTSLIRDEWSPFQAVKTNVNISSGLRCVIYGLGVTLALSFERAMPASNCEVHIFDCSADANQLQAAHQGFTFHDWCIGSWHEELRARSSDMNSWQFKTLSDTMFLLGHVQIDVLKVDAGGMEWRFFETELVAMKRLPEQVLFKLHLEGADSCCTAPELVKGRGSPAADKLLKSLRELGYQIVSKNVNATDVYSAEFVVVHTRQKKNDLIRERSDIQHESSQLEAVKISGESKPIVNQTANHTVNDPVQQVVDRVVSLNDTTNSRVDHAVNHPVKQASNQIVPVKLTASRIANKKQTMNHTTGALRSKDILGKEAIPGAISKLVLGKEIVLLETCFGADDSKQDYDCLNPAAVVFEGRLVVVTRLQLHNNVKHHDFESRLALIVMENSDIPSYFELNNARWHFWDPQHLFPQGFFDCQARNSPLYGDVSGPEDPRLVVYKGMLYITFSSRPRFEGRMDCQGIMTLMYMKAFDGSPAVQVQCDKLGIGTWEKSWLPFVHRNSLYFIQKFLPLTVLKMDEQGSQCTHFQKDGYNPKNVENCHGRSPPILVPVPGCAEPQLISLCAHKEEGIGIHYYWVWIGVDETRCAQNVSCTPQFFMISMEPANLMVPGHNLFIGQMTLQISADGRHRIHFWYGVDDISAQISSLALAEVLDVLNATAVCAAGENRYDEIRRTTPATTGISSTTTTLASATTTTKSGKVG
mmetsp:Transcript_66661/g.126983  ORF Transcript_66661/g.126983 Transcript_66661/m.126983 type:complete len:750 (-) Transcript_66661:289-2538(-)